MLTAANLFNFLNALPINESISMALSTLEVIVRANNRLRFRSMGDSVAAGAARFAPLIFGGILCVCLGGCGTETKSANQTPGTHSIDLASTDTAADSNGSPTSESVASPTTLATDKVSSDRADTSSAPKVDSEIGPARPAEFSPLTGAQSADSETVATQQLPQPSKEQLAKWAHPKFEPLQLLACRESSETGFVSHMAHVMDGEQYITAGTKVVLWSLDSEMPTHVFEELSGEQSIKSLAVSPNGKWFAAGDSEGTLRIWSISDRKQVISKQLYTTAIVQIAISPDGQDVCTISYGDEITTWSVPNLAQKNRFKVDTDSLTRIEYMTNDLLVAAGQTTSSWNIQTGKLDKQLSPGRYNATLARSPDGARFLLGQGETLELWNIATQKSEIALTGGFASSEITAFSDDGQHLATANGFAIRIWDIASGRLVQVIDTFGWSVTGMNWLPKTNLLVVSSLNARVRIWGTKSAGQERGLQPLHATIAMPDRNAHEPATPTQLLHTIDLRTYPRMPGALVSTNNEFSLMYECPANIDEAKLFYRYQLGTDGWSEVEQAVATPHMIKFQKEGFGLTTTFYDGSQLKTMVNVSFEGNYDLRWIPKLDDAAIEVVFENDDTVMYRVNGSVLDIETALLRKLPKAGWTAYSRLNSSHNEEEDVRHLTFLRGSMTLTVFVRRDPADLTKFIVQYGGILTAKSIPVPPDSGYVEFDGSTQPMLVATTAMDLKGTREYYDQAMVLESWLSRDFGRNIKETDRNWLAYIRGQQEVTIGLQRLPNGRTRVTVGEDVERSSWQLAKATPPTSNDSVAIGLEAVDFPILNESKVAKYDAIAKNVEFSMDATPLVKVGEIYKQHLLSMGWKTERPGIMEDDYVFLTFVQDKVEIDLRARVTEGKATVNVQGDGLLWNKPLPGSKRVISYETWLRVNYHPATLDLLDEYLTEMR